MRSNITDGEMRVRLVALHAPPPSMHIPSTVVLLATALAIQHGNVHSRIRWKWPQLQSHLARIFQDQCVTSQFPFLVAAADPKADVGDKVLTITRQHHLLECRLSSQSASVQYSFRRTEAQQVCDSAHHLIAVTECSALLFRLQDWELEYFHPSDEELMKLGEFSADSCSCPNLAAVAEKCFVSAGHVFRLLGVDAREMFLGSPVIAAVPRGSSFRQWHFLCADCLNPPKGTFLPKPNAVWLS
jgi:hypothetical protein